MNTMGGDNAHMIYTDEAAKFSIMEHIDGSGDRKGDYLTNDKLALVLYGVHPLSGDPLPYACCNFVRGSFFHDKETSKFFDRVLPIA